MSIIGSNILAGAAGSGVSAYEIEQSLRFDRASSHYLNETFAAGQNTWTVSFWVKRANLNGVVQCLFGTSTNGYYNDLGFEGSDRLRFRQVYSGVPSENFEMVSTMRFRDPSAWYHIVLSYGAHDGSAAADRAKIWVNNQRLTAFDTANYPGASVSSLLNANTRVHNIGKVGYYDDYLGAYIAEFNFIDGQRLDPDDFGEEDDNGVWRPIEYTGTYGNNNSVYLKFDPTATNGIGHDHSGNGNHWTANNFTTSGTGTDVMSDTPTTNYCTLNPLNSSSSATPSDGNLKFTQSSNDQVSIGTQSMTSGKYYWEVTKNSGENPEIGIIPDTASVANNSTPSATTFNQIAFITNSNNTIRNGSGNNDTVSGLSAQTGAGTIGIAVDMDDHKIWWSDTSGTWFNSGDPAAGTNEAKDFTGLDCANGCMPYIYMGTGSSHTAVLNFGQRDFAYTPPTGFKALNTSNLPAPDIADGSKHFNTALYTATQTAQSITGVGFQPDLVWAKRRSGSAASHNLFDVIRGVRTHLESNTTNSETTEASGASLTSFDTDGFSVGTPNLGAGSVNSNTGDTFVAWNWLAGGSGSSNTDGSITSTVSANPTAGFSIVTYTGNNTSGATVGHGLGVAPSMIICKRRENNAAGTSGWQTYHASLGATKVVYLDKTDSVATDSAPWNNTAPTSTVFTLGNSPPGNPNGDKVVAYCFAEVEGYSKFASYTGNGSTNGPFVYCGFRPAWVLIKRTGGADDWFMYDTARDEYNQAFRALDANTGDVEKTSATIPIDILSSGFKIRSSGTAMNGSGETIIFAAFAENSFGGSGVSPATAR